MGSGHSNCSNPGSVADESDDGASLRWGYDFNDWQGRTEFIVRDVSLQLT